MVINSFKRYEKKFILTKEQYDELIPRLLEYMELDEFCKKNGDYNIFNIYYDTENDDVIRHSINKPYYNEKLRLRSYNPSISLEDKVFLELKKKINGIVTKRRVSLTLIEAYDFLYFNKKPSCNDYLNNQVINEIDYYLKKNEVYPKVYIAYTRNAFFAKDNRDFRLTFDYEILTRRNDLSLESKHYGNNILGENKYLMEVKILGSMPIWFTKILSDLKNYNTHFSKYGNEYMDYCLNKENIYTLRSAN